MTVQVLVRDPQLRIVGRLDGWTSLTAVLRLNTAGTWELKTAATPAAAAMLTPGSGIVILRDGQVYAAGPMDTNPYSRAGVDDAAPGTFTFTGTTDLAQLAERLIYPDPALGSDQQTTESNFTLTAAAGTVLTRLVDVSAGPSALTERRVPFLTIGAGAGVGATASTNARYTALGDELRAVALAGGNLVFDVVQMSSAGGFSPELVFSARVPRDLSTSARFSFALGNLRSVSFAEQAPTVTRAIVAGQGQGVDRTVHEYADTDAEARWGRRVEVFVDRRDTDDDAVLAQAGADALAQGSAQVQLSTVTVDSPLLRYGADGAAGSGIVGYRLGDTVSVNPYGTAVVTDLVRQVTLAATRDGGELVTAVVGSPDQTTDDPQVRAVRAIESRVSSLERNA